MYPVFFTIGTFEVRASYVMTILGILLGVLVGWRESRRLGYSTRHILTFVLVVVPVGLLGGTINSTLFRLTRNLDIAYIQYFLSNGLVSFGVVLAVLLTGWITARIRRQPVSESLDIVSLTLPLILGVYRIGCILNGCCYGVPTESFLGMYLPGRYGEWAARYPTQLGYMLFDFLLFAFLFWRNRRIHKQGSQTAIFLLVFSLGRLLLDDFRDLPVLFLGMNMHQWLALCMLVGTLGVLGVYMVRRRKVF